MPSLALPRHSVDGPQRIEQEQVEHFVVRFSSSSSSSATGISLSEIYDAFRSECPSEVENKMDIAEVHMCNRLSEEDVTVRIQVGGVANSPNLANF